MLRSIKPIAIIILHSDFGEKERKKSWQTSLRRMAPLQPIQIVSIAHDLWDNGPEYKRKNMKGGLTVTTEERQADDI